MVSSTLFLRQNFYHSPLSFLSPAVRGSRSRFSTIFNDRTPHVHARWRVLRPWKRRGWESPGLECDSAGAVGINRNTRNNHHDILEKTGVPLGRWGPSPPSFALVRFQCCTQCLVATGVSARHRATRANPSEGVVLGSPAWKIDGGSFSVSLATVRRKVRDGQFKNRQRLHWDEAHFLQRDYDKLPHLSF